MELATEYNPDPHEMVVSILKDELAVLPMAAYPAKIVMVDTLQGAIQAANDLANEKEIGFDTETKPCFKRGISNNVALLQLSSHSTCYLIRLNKIGLPPEIKNILENPEILKIGVSIHDDFHQLNKLYELNPAGFIDLQSYVKEFMILDNSLARIYAILFGKRISKNQRLTNWEADKLTINQREYAALDALSCVQIYDYLKSGNFQPSASKYYRPLEEVRPVQIPQVATDEAIAPPAKPQSEPNPKNSTKKRKRSSSSNKKRSNSTCTTELSDSTLNNEKSD